MNLLHTYYWVWHCWKNFKGWSAFGKLSCK